MLSETLLKHAIHNAFKHAEKGAKQSHQSDGGSAAIDWYTQIREYINAWETLDTKLRHEHTWQVSWRKIRAHLDSIEDKLERLSPTRE